MLQFKNEKFVEKIKNSYAELGKSKEDLIGCNVLITKKFGSIEKIISANCEIDENEAKKYQVAKNSKAMVDRLVIKFEDKSYLLLPVSGASKVLQIQS